MKHAVRTLAEMIVLGEGGAVLRELCARIYSDEVSIVLRRDLLEDHFVPAPRIAIKLRPLEARDIPTIVSERPRRLPVILDNVPGGYVAVTDTGELAFMIWVIFGDQWPIFETHFKGNIPRALEPDECMFEFAYTFKKFRGMGVMSAAMILIVEEARRLRPTARWGYNYIRQSNEPSLRGCRNAGFRPFMKREEHWRAMRLQQSFIQLTSASMFPFERVADQLAGHCT